MKRRISLAIVLTVLMVGTLSSAVAFAEDGDDDSGNRRPLPCYADQ